MVEEQRRQAISSIEPLSPWLVHLLEFRAAGYYQYQPACLPISIIKLEGKKILYLLLLSKFRSPKERAGPETPDKTRLPRNEPCETEAPARTRSRTKHAAPANEEGEEAGAIPGNGNAGRPSRLPGFLLKLGTMIRRYGWGFPQGSGGWSIQAGARRGSLSLAPVGEFSHRTFPPVPSARFGVRSHVGVR